MIWDLLEWLHLVDQSVLLKITLNQKTSSLIFILYLVSFKKSWRFAVAFLICEFLYLRNFFGAFDNLDGNVYAALFYLAISLTWSLAVSSQIKPKMNKSLAFWCSIMMLFLLLMAWDSWHNYDTETYIYRHYENVIVCIHACIILSLYKPRAIINSMVDKFRDLISQLRSSYTMQFICYNLEQCKTFLAK